MVLLLTFTGMALGWLLAAGALHGRGPVSLLGPSRLWVQGFVAALAAVLVIYLPLTLLGLRLAPPEPGLPLMRWLSLLPLMVPMLFLQIFAEEVLFRGYQQQQLAALVARWIWFGIPSVLFALLHISPIAGANLPIVLLGVLTFAFLAADLAERTGSLGASMGLHFGNNFFGLFILATRHHHRCRAFRQPIAAGSRWVGKPSCCGCDSGAAGGLVDDAQAFACLVDTPAG